MTYVTPKKIINGLNPLSIPQASSMVVNWQKFQDNSNESGLIRTKKFEQILFFKIVSAS